MKVIFASVLAGIALAGANFASAATLIHQYTFQNTYADDLNPGNTNDALTPDGGTLGAGNYTFGADQGLHVATNGGYMPAFGQYTIEVDFDFTTTSSYRKILDFKNLGADAGLYNLNDDLSFYNHVTSATAVLAANVLADVVLTRDSSGVVTGYVNGVQEIQYNDSSAQDGTFSSNIMRFFEDDTHTGGNEASPGQVDYIRIWDDALSDTQVAALTTPSSPVPLPAGAVGGAVLLAGIAARRRLAK